MGHVTGTPLTLGDGDAMYLVVMLAVIAVVAIVGVLKLFRKRCPDCGKPNTLDALECEQCGRAFEDTK